MLEIFKIIIIASICSWIGFYFGATEQKKVCLEVQELQQQQTKEVE